MLACDVALLTADPTEKARRSTGIGAGSAVATFATANSHCEGRWLVLLCTYPAYSASAERLT